MDKHGEGEGQRSERAQGAPGWEVEPFGAGNDGDRAWVYVYDDASVKVAWVDGDGRSRMCVVPNEVLAHVLRAQGYEVDEGMEAAR